MTIETMAQIRFPGDVQLSPDGKRVAFVVWEWVPDEQARHGILVENPQALYGFAKSS